MTTLSYSKDTSSLIHNSSPHDQNVPALSAKNSNNGERKFNLVIYGINESTKGSHRDSRLLRDTNAVNETLKVVDDSISELSIRDCLRLGKFSETKCRPILVTLNRSSDVLSILSKRAKLSSIPGISIKPDMTKEQRKIESILLRERWILIQSGVHRRCIRLRGDSIFVNNKKHGSVADNEFVPFASVSPVLERIVPASSASIPSSNSPPKSPHHSQDVSNADLSEN